MDFSQQTAPEEPAFAVQLRVGLPVAAEWLPEVDSTSSELRRRIEAGALAAPLLLYTDRQSAGRGTRGRDWQQPDGQSGLDLALTLAIPFNDAWQAEPRLSLFAGAVLAEALHAACGLRVGLKWPNDLLLLSGGAWCKCGGLLLETLPQSAQRWLLCGLGLNINSTAAQYLPQLRARLTTLSAAAGRPQDRGAVHLACAGALCALFTDAAGWDIPALLAAWRERDQTAGTRYVLLRDGKRLPVTAVGVDLESGGLRVRLPGGALTLVQSYTELEAPGYGAG